LLAIIIVRDEAVFGSQRYYKCLL